MSEFTNMVTELLEVVDPRNPFPESLEKLAVSRDPECISAALTFSISTAHILASFLESTGALSTEQLMVLLRKSSVEFLNHIDPQENQ